MGLLFVAQSIIPESVSYDEDAVSALDPTMAENLTRIPPRTFAEAGNENQQR